MTEGLRMESMNSEFEDAGGIFIDFYQRLGVFPNAGSKEIENAYLRLKYRYSVPRDAVTDEGSGDVQRENRLEVIRKAKEWLTDPYLRLEYDEVHLERCLTGNCRANVDINEIKSRRDALALQDQLEIYENIPDAVGESDVILAKSRASRRELARSGSGRCDHSNRGSERGTRHNLVVSRELVVLVSCLIVLGLLILLILMSSTE